VPKTAPKSRNSSASVLKTSSHKRCRWKRAKHWFRWISRKRWAKMVSGVPKMIVLRNFVIKSKLLRRVWPYGGIFCLTFFREGCSPSGRDDPAQMPSHAKTSFSSPKPLRQAVTHSVTSVGTLLWRKTPDFALKKTQTYKMLLKSQNQTWKVRYWYFHIKI